MPGKPLDRPLDIRSYGLATTRFAMCLSVFARALRFANWSAAIGKTRMKHGDLAVFTSGVVDRKAIVGQMLRSEGT